MHDTVLTSNVHTETGVIKQPKAQAQTVHIFALHFQRRREKKRQEKNAPATTESSKANSSKNSRHAVSAGGDTGAVGVKKPSNEDAEVGCGV